MIDYKTTSYNWYQTHKEWAAAYQREHKEEHAIATRRYRETHIEERIAYNRQYREMHPGQRAAQYQAHREHEADLMRQWYQTHKEKQAAYTKQWRKNHKVQTNAIAERRRARKKGIGYDLTYEQWQDILEEFNYCCAYCLKSSDCLTQEHMIPLSRGGLHTRSNIIPACQSCNSKKYTRTLLEYIVAIRGY